MGRKYQVSQQIRRATGEIGWTIPDSYALGGDYIKDACKTHRPLPGMELANNGCLHTAANNFFYFCHLPPSENIANKKGRVLSSLIIISRGQLRRSVKQKGNKCKNVAGLPTLPSSPKQMLTICDSQEAHRDYPPFWDLDLATSFGVIIKE